MAVAPSQARARPPRASPRPRPALCTDPGAPCRASGSVLSNFAAGALCSVGAWALIYPLDTAKSVIQAAGSSEKSLSILGALAQVYRRAGIRGWYAGLGAGLLRAFTSNGLGMVAYGWATALLG